MGSGAKEGQVNDLFKKRLSSLGFFRNIYLSSNAQQATGHATAYATMPDVVNSIKGKKLTLDDLRNENKAKYLFSTGDGQGSLVDLILETHGTTFPSESVDVWATPEVGRKGRSSGRGGV